MNKPLKLSTGVSILLGNCFIMTLCAAKQRLNLVYPPLQHKTASESIFFIGTADPQGPVFINNQPVQRSKAGHFAPSFPLKIGHNTFKIRYNNQEITVNVERIATQIKPPSGVAFAPNSLTPSQTVTRLPKELICFSAIAPEKAQVSVTLAGESLPLFPQTQGVNLPEDSKVLTGNNQANKTSIIGYYQGCTKVLKPGLWGYPVFKLTLNNQTISHQGSGQINILDPQQLEVIEVTAEQGITRTGPSEEYSRLTPLPKGTKATVTGKEGNWLRLDYGAWILSSETKMIPDAMPVKSLIRGVSSRQLQGTTEVIFPLEMPVPISVRQEDNKFILTLYNTTAQTDTIQFNDDPLIKRLDWQQVSPDKVEYIFTLKSGQQWGYDLNYQGSNLVLSLQHPPAINQGNLKGVRLLLDAGHGGQEMGAKGPTGYPEKDINLIIAKLLKEELIKRGATVYMTRETDKDVSLKERVDQINKLKPTLSISIHYNALPDDGDAMNTQGMGIFWYHPQAHDLSVFLQKYLVEKLDRPSYGVFWKNLALTRPHTTPSILLELGFMINPNEFEWITNSQEQEKLAGAIADGIVEWLSQQN